MAAFEVITEDFTSEYPSCCALLGLFELLTAESVSFEHDTENIQQYLKQITLAKCFERNRWPGFRFFALVKPDKDILPVRTVYDGVTQNIGNNYLSANPDDPQPQWFAGSDLIASAIRTGKAPKVIRAIRMVPHGKQAGMKKVNLRSMVEIDPYSDDIFTKIIEERKRNKADDDLYYWLKILANSIYGFFVELNPEIQNETVHVNVFSGEKKIPDCPTDVIERPGLWFFAPLASLITSAGRLMLAMAEKCVTDAGGTWLYADTDSLGIVSSKDGGHLRIPGSEGVRILPWKEVQAIVDKFADLNPYNRELVKGSILNLTDANYIDSDPKKPRRQLYGYSIAVKRYNLYEKMFDESRKLIDIMIVDAKAHGLGYLYPPKDSPKDWNEDVPQWIYELWDYITRGALKLRRKKPTWLNRPQMMRLTITTYNVLKMLGEWRLARPYNFLLLPMVDPLYSYVFYRKPNDKILLVTPFCADQERWYDLKCTNVHDGKQYRMVDYMTERDPRFNIVFPSNFARLLVTYQEHPEAKSLGPDGKPCESDTKGLLQRSHIIARGLRYIGKETDRKWEEGEDFSLLDFKTTEYGRANKLKTPADLKDEISKIPLRKLMGITGMSHHTLLKARRGEITRRTTLERIATAIQTLKQNGSQE